MCTLKETIGGFVTYHAGYVDWFLNVLGRRCFCSSVGIVEVEGRPNGWSRIRVPLQVRISVQNIHTLTASSLPMYMCWAGVAGNQIIPMSVNVALRNVLYQNANGIRDVGGHQDRVNEVHDVLAMAQRVWATSGRLAAVVDIQLNPAMPFKDEKPHVLPGQACNLEAAVCRFHPL